MTDRERLIDLIKKAEKQELIDFLTADLDEAIDMSVGTQFNGTVEYLADYLISNGVIVPPCKVGDTVYAVKGCFYLPHVYFIKPSELIRAEVIATKETKSRKILLLKPLIEDCFYTRKSNKWFPFSAYGKTVFLTRKEAERALNDMKQGESQ